MEFLALLVEFLLEVGGSLVGGLLLEPLALLLQGCAVVVLKARLQLRQRAALLLLKLKLQPHRYREGERVCERVCVNVCV